MKSSGSESGGNGGTGLIRGEAISSGEKRNKAHANTTGRLTTASLKGGEGSGRQYTCQPASQPMRVKMVVRAFHDLHLAFETVAWKQHIYQSGGRPARAMMVVRAFHDAQLAFETVVWKTSYPPHSKNDVSSEETL